ncbi:MAG: hypothetical protein WCC95_22460, partial [Candidatus Sulfotelmatobacter sp.]
PPRSETFDCQSFGIGKRQSRIDSSAVGAQINRLNDAIYHDKRPTSIEGCCQRPDEDLLSGLLKSKIDN